MQDAIKIAGQVERDAQKLNQLLLNKNSLSFDEKKQIEDLLQKKKDLDALVKDIQADNKKNMVNRQENEQQNKELLDKQKEIENLFNNVLDQKNPGNVEKAAGPDGPGTKGCYPRRTVKNADGQQILEKGT